MLFRDINPKNFQKEYAQLCEELRSARNPVSDDLRKKLVQTCQKNPWLRVHGIPFEDDPFFELDSPYEFCEYEDLSALKLFFDHGNWSIRQGVVYKDLFFCNQVNGGDEWWTCKLDPATGEYVDFDSITMHLIIERGEFEDLIQRLCRVKIKDGKRVVC